MQIIEPLMTLEAPISKVTPDKLIVDIGAEFTGIISKNDVALKACDKNTSGFSVGDMVRAVVISEKDGIVKMSIRKLQQQRRDLEAEHIEKAEAEIRAAIRLQEEKRRQAEKRQCDLETKQAKAAFWFQEEKRRWRENKKAHLKRYGAISAFGIAAMFTAAMFISNVNDDAGTEKAGHVISSKYRGVIVEEYGENDPRGQRPFAPWEKNIIRVYRNSDADTENSLVAFLESLGAEVKRYDHDDPNGYRPFEPGEPKTIRSYINHDEAATSQ